MSFKITDDIIRVVILSVKGVYAKIYDEVYCTEEKYTELQSEFGSSEDYKVIKI